jgi:hypothetical protein
MGHNTEAIAKLCEDTEQHWRLVSLMGGNQFDHRGAGGVVPRWCADSQGRDFETGSRRQFLWKMTCWRLAEVLNISDCKSILLY